jgi:hypothetical protein
MHLLNEPWREFERTQRRQENARLITAVIYGLACFLAGIALGLAL